MDQLRPAAPRFPRRGAARPRVGWLPPWPDAVEGLKRLQLRYVVSTLSNGNRSQQEGLVRHARLPFTRLMSAEDFHHYKPDPEIYLGAASSLGVAPDRVMMVAAHKGDLRAAQA